MSNETCTLTVTLGVRVQTVSQQFLSAEPQIQSTTEGFMLQEAASNEFCSEFILPYHKTEWPLL